MSSDNPTYTEVEEAINGLDEAIRRIGDATVRPISGSTDGGQTILGRVAQRGSSTYTVFGAVGDPKATVRYEFNAAEAVAADRARADGGHAAGQQEGGVQVQPTEVQRAADDIRDSLGDLGAQDVRMRLVDRISEPPFGYSILDDDELPIGFQSSTRVYPYHEDIEVSSFSDRVQGLLGVGIKGQVYLINEFGITDLVDSGSTDDDGRRGFQ